MAKHHQQHKPTPPKPATPPNDPKPQTEATPPGDAPTPAAVERSTPSSTDAKLQTEAVPPDDAPIPAPVERPASPQTLGQDDIVREAGEVQPPAAVEPPFIQSPSDAPPEISLPNVPTVPAPPLPAPPVAAIDPSSDDADDEVAMPRDADDESAEAHAEPVDPPLTESMHWRTVLSILGKPSAVAGYQRRKDFHLPRETAVRLNEIWGAMTAAGVTFPNGKLVKSPGDALVALVDLTHTYLVDVT